MQQRQSLGPWALALINISAILSLRHLPAQAVFGMSSIYFYVIGAVIFLIPVSLICAELATTWSNRHGLYGWIYEAFGPRLAVLVVWWSWMAAVATIVTNLVFCTVLFTGVFFPAYAHSSTFVMMVSLLLLWAITLVNLKGMKLSSYISSIGAIFGTIAPILLLSVLAFYLSMNRSDLAASSANILIDPDFDTSDLSLLSTVILGYSGIELAAFHAADARDPKKDYFKALMIAAAVISSLYILGTLAIILVLPPKDITLTLGVVQAFEAFFKLLGLEPLSLMIHCAMIVGTLAAINSWLISPAKGIFAAAEHFYFPSWMTYSNKQHVPVNILLLQAVIASFLLVALKLSPTVESSFWMLSMLTTQYAIILYLPIIAAFLLLKYSQSSLHRPFCLSLKSAWLCATFALVTSVVVLVLTLIPPARIGIENIFLYEFFFLVAFIFFSLPPLLFKRISVVKGKA